MSIDPNKISEWVGQFKQQSSTWTNFLLSERIVFYDYRDLVEIVRSSFVKQSLSTNTSVYEFNIWVHDDKLSEIVKGFKLIHSKDEFEFFGAANSALVIDKNHQHNLNIVVGFGPKEVVEVLKSFKQKTTHDE